MSSTRSTAALRMAKLRSPAGSLRFAAVRGSRRGARCALARASLRSCFAQRAKPEPLVQSVASFSTSGPLSSSDFDLERQRHVGLHRDEHAARGQPVLHLAQVLAHHALHFVGVRDHFFERAVLLDQLRGGLRAHLVHAGHVVHRVAHEREVVDDAIGRHAELRLHAGGVELLVVRHGVDPQHPVGHELRQVLVAGGDRPSPSRARARRASTSVPITSSASTPSTTTSGQPSAGMISKSGPICAREVLGHRLARGLVFGIDLVAEGLALGIEHRGDIIRGEVLLELLEHAHHAADRARRLARRRCAAPAARGKPDRGSSRRRPAGGASLCSFISLVARIVPWPSPPPRSRNPRIPSSSGARRIPRAKRGGCSKLSQSSSPPPSELRGDPARGRDLRQRAHDAGPSVLHARRGHRAAPVGRGLLGDLGRRARESWKRSTRAPSQAPAPAWA